MKTLMISKVVNPGNMDGLASKPVPVYCKINYSVEDGKGRLSISGVEGPKRNGDCWGGCGQINPVEVGELAEGWTSEMLAKFNQIWERWHLNDMRAGCEHQRGIDTSKQVEFISWNWSDKFYTMMKQAEHAELSAVEYANYQAVCALVNKVVIGTNRPLYKSAEVERLLSDGWIVEGKHESKSIGWVRPEEHPEGILCKPCEVCGYKYGTAWLHEEVPADVIQWLESLPDSSSVPAWV